MKKNVLRLVVISGLLVLLSSAVAFAADSTTANTDSGQAGDPLELTGLSIQVSAGVVANYYVSGSAPIQWYALSTSHVDGTRAFGTAQNSTNIYYNETDTTATAVTFPASDEADSDDAWSTANWDRQ
jgi:hypothetical protein